MSVSNDPRDDQSVKDLQDMRMALAAFRDRFPELDNEQYERLIVQPVYKALRMLFIRRTAAQLRGPLRAEYIETFFGERGEVLPDDWP